MTDDIEYKKLEVMLNIPREMMIEKILHHREQDLQAESHEWLVDELLWFYRNTNRPVALECLTDKELAQKCVEIFDEHENDDWWEEQ